MFCRMYWDTPPEELTKADFVNPQILKMSANASKNVKFKMFRGGNDIEMGTSVKVVEGSITTNRIRTNSMPTCIYSTMELGYGTYTIMNTYEVPVTSGEFTVTNSLFNIPIIMENMGRYRLKINCYTNDDLIGTNIIPMVVC